MKIIRVVKTYVQDKGASKKRQKEILNALFKYGMVTSEEKKKVMKRIEEQKEK